MPQPESAEEYDRRFHENVRVEGFFANTRTVLPCPFCAAADWMVYPVTAALNDYADLARPHQCKECGRWARFITTRTACGGITQECVQTAGDDPPPWLNPAPRRE